MGGSNMKKIRNILSLALVFIMLIGLMPMNVFASNPPAGTGTETGTPADPAPTTDLQAKKDAAKAEVEGLNNIFKADKDAALSAIEQASDENAVTAAVTEANTKEEAAKKVRDAAKKEIEELADLSKDKKDAAIAKINAATTEDEVKAAVTAAKQQAEDDKKAKEEEEKKKAAEKALEDAKTKAKEEIKNDKTLTEEQKKAANKAIDKADTPEKVQKAVADAKKAAKPDTTPVKTVKVVTIGNGTASVDNECATKGQSVTVTAKPYSGYAVARVYYIDASGDTKNINTYYNGYYYDGRYYGRYNDYNKYLYVYENSSYYLRKYDSYREFLRYEYPSHYRYYEDYDYWTDRYDYDWYDRYDNYYYKYLDDFRRKYSDIYDNYEEYLRAIHPNHYYNYRYLDRYDYRYHNYRYGYNTSDTFDMPASNVTVYVEFIDWSYYGYYYDDYYYYRSRRDKEAEAKKEAAKKEEEAKAKAEAEKLPQVYENKAVIAIGSNVLDKVSKNVHTVHQMDTPAYVKNGRVMLPLRYVAEALGLQVSWVPETKTVIIWDLTQRVEIPVKSNRIIVNGITYTSDVKPEIKSSRTMLPIANIARALGLIDGSDIIWDQYNKQVTLTRKVLSK